MYSMIEKWAKGLFHIALSSTTCLSSWKVISSCLLNSRSSLSREDDSEKGLLRISEPCWVEECLWRHRMMHRHSQSQEVLLLCCIPASNRTGSRECWTLCRIHQIKSAMVQLREDASLHSHRTPLDRGFENCEWNWQSCGCEGVGFDCFPESSNPLHWREMLPVRWESEHSGFATPQIDWHWQVLFYGEICPCWEFGSVHQGLSISGLHSHWRKQLPLFFFRHGEWIRKGQLINRPSCPFFLCDRWWDWDCWQLL